MPNPDAVPPLDLDAIERRANAATPGPWWVANSWGDSPQISYGPAPGHEPPYNNLVVSGCDEYNCGVLDSADAEFICAARTDIPALVARVRHLEVERAEHTELLKWLGHMIGTLAWWESDDSRACIPCDGCRIEGREMAEALAPWRDQFVRELNGP